MINQNHDSATIFIHFVQCHPFSPTITNIFTHFLFIYVIFFQLFSSMTTSIMIPISSFTTTYSIISILCILNCCQIFSCPSPWHHLDATIIIIIIVCDPLLPEKNQRMHPCTWWPLDICSGFRSWTHDVVVDCDDGADYWWYQQLFFWTCEEKADPPPPPAKWQHGGNWKLIWPKSQGGGII